MKRAGTAACGTRSKFGKLNKRKIHTSNTNTRRRGKKAKNKFINLESEFRFFKGNTKGKKSKRRRPNVFDIFYKWFIFT